VPFTRNYRGFSPTSLATLAENGHPVLVAFAQLRSLPESLACDSGALRTSGELRPHHIGRDVLVPGEGAKAAVRAGDDAGAVTEGFIVWRGLFQSRLWAGVRFRPK
jgi:hypothetical protein